MVLSLEAFLTCDVLPVLWNPRQFSSATFCRNEKLSAIFGASFFSVIVVTRRLHGCVFLFRQAAGGHPSVQMDVNDPLLEESAGGVAAETTLTYPDEELAKVSLHCLNTVLLMVIMVKLEFFVALLRLRFDDGFFHSCFLSPSVLPALTSF